MGKLWTAISIGLLVNDYGRIQPVDIAEAALTES